MARSRRHKHDKRNNWTTKFGTLVGGWCFPAFFYPIIGGRWIFCVFARIFLPSYLGGTPRYLTEFGNSVWSFPLWTQGRNGMNEWGVGSEEIMWECDAECFPIWWSLWFEIRECIYWVYIVFCKIYVLLYVVGTETMRWSHIWVVWECLKTQRFGLSPLGASLPTPHGGNLATLPPSN